MKKKKKKDWVRREVNYMLDYDSPYSEYLVARFREWSPQVHGPQKPIRHQSNQHFEEVKNAYAQRNDGGSSSRGHSRQISPNKQASAAKKPKHDRAANMADDMPNFNQPANFVKPESMMVEDVEDFEP